MTRDEFMKVARGDACEILKGRENQIMNLVQRAWAEGKRNTEVETIKESIIEALDKRDNNGLTLRQKRILEAFEPISDGGLADIYEDNCVITCNDCCAENECDKTDCLGTLEMYFRGE